MQCPRCQQQNLPEANFCLKCGTPLKSFSASGSPGASYTEIQHALSEALEQQTATSEILGVISRSPTDIQPVLDTVVESAARLCEAYDANIVLRRDNRLVLAAHHGRIHDASAIARALGTIGGFTLSLDRGTLGGRTVLDARTVHIADVQVEAEEFPEASENARRLGFHTMLSVPLMREGVAIGAIQLPRTEVRLFTERQVALLKTFADQAAVAIENVRLFKELEARNRDLTEALEQQTATGEILHVISSSPTDLGPVLEAVVENAARLCEAPDVIVSRIDGDIMRVAARHGPWTSAVPFPETLSITRDSVSGRAVIDRRTVYVHDLSAETDEEYSVGKEFQRRWGHRTILVTPLLSEGIPLGVIGVFRTEVRAFSDAQIKLLETFAHQAAIAIENVRLFKELEVRNAQLTESLTQQTATAEILRVISSSPTDIQPVLDTVVKSAARLCDAYDAQIFQREGDQLLFVAHHGPMPSGPVGEYTVPLVRGTINGRSVLEGLPVHVADVQAERDEFPEGSEIARRYGHRTVLSLPLMREGVAIGTISVRRAEIRPFTERQIALLKTFADQAVIALENVRLFKELEVRNRDLTEALEQQTATSEILRVISQSPTDLQPVLDT